MSIQDKAICKALDRLHTDLVGLRAPCRFVYDGKTDVYACQHGEISGRHVIKETHLMRDN